MVVQMYNPGAPVARWETALDSWKSGVSQSGHGRRKSKQEAPSQSGRWHRLTPELSPDFRVCTVTRLYSCSPVGVHTQD